MRKVLIANRGEIAVRIARACRDAGIDQRRGLRRARPRRAARPGGRRGVRPGRQHPGRLLPRRRQAPRRRRAGRRRRRPSRLRLPRRERRLRPGGDRRRTDLDRPAPERHRRPRRQGQGPPHRRAGRRPAGRRHQGPGRGRRRGRRVRQGARPAGRDQGGVRRRRPRAQGRARPSRRSPSCSTPRYARPSPRSAAASASSRGTSTSRATSRPSASPTSTATSSWSPPATARCSDATRSSSRRRRRRSSPTSRTPSSTARPRRSCARPGYVGAGTCEFLVGQDGTISFLEVNTRLQVEHPVTEEVTGIDLVREMFRIADGEALGYDDPPVRGHSIEFRINAEDAGRNFLPAPGTLSHWSPPSGPGVRLDAGYEVGETIPGAFDSLVAKLIVTGATREQALERSRRALAEFEVDGMPTVIAVPPRGHGGPRVHRRAVPHPHPVDRDRVRQHHRAVRRRRCRGGGTGRARPGRRRGGRTAPRGRTAVGSWCRRRVRGQAASPHGEAAARRPAPPPAGTALTSPMQGTIVKVAAEEGQQVAEGDPIVVLEAMKMEQPLTAHKGWDGHGFDR